MAIGDAINKGKAFLDQNKEKIDDAIKSEKAEQVSDKALDAAAGFAKKVAPGASDKVDGIRDNIDKRIGNE